MEWRDRGLILASRRHGEGGVILELMTRHHGRHLGLVRGGRGRKYHAMLQAGNEVQAIWRARLSEHLGTFAIDLARAHAARLMESRMALAVFETMAAHLRLLAERQSHTQLFDASRVLLEHMESSEVAALLVRFEIELLRELGFGLDLSACAASGACHDLVYVSPRSGRAVSRQAGAPYHARLLPLPGFVRDRNSDYTPDTLADGLKLTGYFLTRHLYGARGLSLPPARRRIAPVGYRQDPPCRNVSGNVAGG